MPFLPSISTPPPKQARDFCTIVHYRKLKDGSLVVINRSADHVKAPRSDKYVRSEILLAGNGRNEGAWGRWID